MSQDRLDDLSGMYRADGRMKIGRLLIAKKDLKNKNLQSQSSNEYI